MKKRLLLLVCLSAMLASCNTNILKPSSDENSNDNSTQEATSSQEKIGEAPKIRGNRDIYYDLKAGEYLFLASEDLIRNTTATDAEDGDLTDKITFTITDYYTGEEVKNLISLENDRKYKLLYSVVDSNGNKATEINYIVVGDPANKLDENGNPREIIDTRTEEEKINETYELIFFEDFNYTGAPGTVEGEADYNAYTYQTGGGGWGNNEVQIYEKNDRTCYVSDGNLKISVVKDGGNYYSARLNTSNAFSANWLYGKYEVTAKLPVGAGPWPAIWMMPNNYGYHGTWPQCGEIDIMETSQYYKNSIIGTVHTQAYNHIQGTQKSGRVNNINVTEYHKYSIEWLPDCIKFLFDDSCYFVFRPSNYTKEVTVNEWPYDYAFHFIFNIAMGGNMGGDISSTLFEEYSEIAMYIDKIAVYQSTYINEKYR